MPPQMPALDDYQFKKLPRSVQGRVEELLGVLRSAWGEGFTGFVLFGSVARGEWTQGRSDLDAVIVGRDLSQKALAAVSEAIAIAEAAVRLDPLLLEEGEIQRSADVWPLLFRDVVEHRVVLAGRDAFADLVIREEHVALAIEQELREALRELRRGLVDARDDDALLAACVEACLRRVRVPLRALLRAEGVEVGHGLSPILAKATRKYRLDATALERARTRPAPAADELVSLLRHAIATADQRNGVDASRGERV
jgi:predicted nucleotidyltransferase